jgi:hypothetical protein
MWSLSKQNQQTSNFMKQFYEAILRELQAGDLPSLSYVQMPSDSSEIAPYQSII